MQKSWYIIYTKPKNEKKVAILLSKRKIESYCPLNCVKTQAFRRSKIFEEPLFKSYVFANITDDEIPLIMRIDGVINLLYWMGKPAVITKDEINAIKEFTSIHNNIGLERTHVDIYRAVQIIEGPTYSLGGKVFALKNKVVKVNLPSIGYMMVSKMEQESFFTSKVIKLQNNSFSNLWRQ